MGHHSFSNERALCHYCTVITIIVLLLKSWLHYRNNLYVSKCYGTYDIKVKMSNFIFLFAGLISLSAQTQTLSRKGRSLVVGATNSTQSKVCVLITVLFCAAPKIGMLHRCNVNVSFSRTNRERFFSIFLNVIVVFSGGNSGIYRLCQ